jgi:pterin-4a-carbinolamine dehydratase
MSIASMPWASYDPVFRLIGSGRIFWRNAASTLSILKSHGYNLRAVSKIFVSYRREDSGPVARRLADSLARAFGPNNVFIDTDSIRIGTKWKDEINKAIHESSVLVVVIGKLWLFLQDTNGRRRIDNKNDWVRTEVLSGFEAGRTVLPILVSGATLPRLEALPASLQPLLDSQGYELNDTYWERDSAYLFERIEALGIPRTSSDSIGSDLAWPQPIDKSKELTEAELDHALATLPGWKIVNRTHPKMQGRKTVELYRIFEFKSFEDAMHFMSTAARKFSEKEHHPDWQNTWVSVQVWLTTWDIGHRPSFKDVRLAEYLENLYREYTAP